MDGWNEIPWGIFLPLIVISLLLTVIALVDCLRNDETRGPKVVWILIILLINLVGPILYFVVGRRNQT